MDPLLPLERLNAYIEFIFNCWCLCEDLSTTWLLFWLCIAINYYLTQINQNHMYHFTRLLKASTLLNHQINPLSLDRGANGPMVSKERHVEGSEEQGPKITPKTRTQGKREDIKNVTNKFTSGPQSPSDIHRISHTSNSFSSMDMYRFLAVIGRLPDD